MFLVDHQPALPQHGARSGGSAGLANHLKRARDSTAMATRCIEITSPHAWFDAMGVPANSGRVFQIENQPPDGRACLAAKTSYFMPGPVHGYQF